VASRTIQDIEERGELTRAEPVGPDLLLTSVHLGTPWWGSQNQAKIRLRDGIRGANSVIRDQERPDGSWWNEMRPPGAVVVLAFAR
jgi:hypothetical protein